MPVFTRANGVCLAVFRSEPALVLVFFIACWVPVVLGVLGLAWLEKKPKSAMFHPDVGACAHYFMVAAAHVAAAIYLK